MKRLVAKFLISMACCVIMLHAVVPHHHHDFDEGGGFVFETEFACHCDDDCLSHTDHHGHSHHPFDICLLQEMLSHLVLTTNDDQHFHFLPSKSGSFHWFFSDVPSSLLTLQLLRFESNPVQYGPYKDAFLVQQPLLGSHSLRAPPYLG